MKYRKNIIKIIGQILIFLVIICRAEICHASYLGSLTVWNSDYDNIGRWGITNPSVKVNKLNLNGDFPFVTKMTTAITSWNVALGISMYATSNTNANIKAYGGTMDELALYGFTLNSDMGGKTCWDKTYEGYWLYNYSSYKGGYIISGARLCVVDNEYSYYNCDKPCLHELGHALGWMGHSPLNTDIMYYNFTMTTSLTNRDKNHLLQIFP